MPKIHSGSQHRQSYDTSRHPGRGHHPNPDTRTQRCAQSQLQARADWESATQSKNARDTRRLERMFNPPPQRPNDQGTPIQIDPYGIENPVHSQNGVKSYQIALKALKELLSAGPNDRPLVLSQELTEAIQDESRDISGRTPIQAALQTLASEENLEGENPLLLLLSYPKAKSEWIDTWIENQGSLDGADGDTALNIAFRAKNFDCVRHLMDLGLCKNTRYQKIEMDNKYDPILANCLLEVIEYLLQKESVPLLSRQESGKELLGRVDDPNLI